MYNFPFKAVDFCALLVVALASLCAPRNTFAGAAAPRISVTAQGALFARAAHAPEPLYAIAIWLTRFVHPCEMREAARIPLRGAILPNKIVAKGGDSLLDALIKFKPRSTATSLRELCPAESDLRWLTQSLREALEEEVSESLSFWEITRATIVVALRLRPDAAGGRWSLDTLLRLGADHALAYFWFELELNDCSGCSVPIGFAWMRREGDVWRVYAGEFPSAQDGSHGSPPDLFGAVRIGEKQWAVRLSTYGSHEEFGSRWEALYVAEGQHTRKLMDIVVEHDDGGARDSMNRNHNVDFSFAFMGCDARCPLLITLTERYEDEREEWQARATTHVAYWRNGAYQLPKFMRVNCDGCGLNALERSW